MLYLKKDTASQEVMIGPFVDSTDGVTPETGLSIANTDIRIHKTGASVFANKNSGGATHIEDGFYLITMDATDTNTAGPLKMQITMAGALPVWEDVWVHGSNIFNAWIGTIHQTTDVNAWLGVAAPDLPQAVTDVAAILVDTATTIPATIATVDSNVDSILTDTGTTLPSTLSTIDGIVDAILVDTAEIGTAGAGLSAIPTQDANVVEWLGTTPATPTVAGVPEVDLTHNQGSTSVPSSLAYWAGTTHVGLAQAGAAGSITLKASEGAGTGSLDGRFITITAGTGEGQTRRISTYSTSTKIASVTQDWTTTPDNTSYYLVSPAAGVDVDYWDGTALTSQAVDVAGIPTVNMSHADGEWQGMANFNKWFRYMVVDVNITSSTSTTVTTDLTGYGDDEFNGQLLTFRTDGNANGQTRRITDYVSSTGVFTVDRAWGTNPGVFDDLFILPTSWETDNAAIATAMLAGSVSEPTAGDEAWSGLTVEKLLGAAYVLLKNEQTLNRTTNAGTVRNNADNANLMTFTDDDDGTTFTKGKRGT